MNSRILPKNEWNILRIHWGYYLECVLLIFWKNPGLHNLLSRFTDLYNSMPNPYSPNFDGGFKWVYKLKHAKKKRFNHGRYFNLVPCSKKCVKFFEKTTKLKISSEITLPLQHVIRRKSKTYNQFPVLFHSGKSHQN